MGGDGQDRAGVTGRRSPDPAPAVTLPLMVPPTTDTEASLQRIIAWFATELGQPDLGLGPPATAEQLTAAEQAIGGSLPGSVHAAYRLADGQRSRTLPSLFPDAFWWLPLDVVVSTWTVMIGLFEGDDSEEFGKSWWHPGLIPLAENGGGDGIYVDLDGRNDGVVGEMTYFVHDDWPSQRTARSHPEHWSTDVDGFESLLRRYATDLEAGRYTSDGRFLTPAR